MRYTDVYKQWKTALAGTEYQPEIDALEADEALCEDSFYQYLEFGTAGMRGTIGLGTCLLYTSRCV